MADDVVVRRCRREDRGWLLRAGLDPEKAGTQYSWAEVPLQLVVAPGRAALCTRAPAAIVEVDGRRAGYIGPNPLSKNLEYFLQPWARGGRGATTVAGWFRLFPHRTAPVRFFVSSKNYRSLRSLQRGLAQLGWADGHEYRVEPARFGRHLIVDATAVPGSPG